MNKETGEWEWVTWFCAEEPVARFFDTLEVDLVRGKGKLKLEDEMIESVEEGSIKVLSVVSSFIPIMGVGTFDASTGEILVKVWTSLFRRKPKRVTVRIEGLRRGHPERFMRRTEKEAKHNDSFWSLAHLGFYREANKNAPWI